MSRQSFARVYFSVVLAILVMLSGNPGFAATATRSSNSSKSTATRSAGGSGSVRGSGGSASSTRSGNHGSRSRSGSPTRVKGSSTHRRGHSYRGGRYYGHGYSSYYYPFYGGYYHGSLGYYGGLFSYYGPHFGLSYYGGYGAYGGYSDGYGYGGSREYPSGALDLNVKPKKTGVFLDGQYIGTTGSYDGYPRHLWVEEGYHEVTFYLEGFRTETRRIRVQRGALIDVTFKMQPGESVRPQERAPEIDGGADWERNRDWRRRSDERYSNRDGEYRIEGDRRAREESDRDSGRDLRAEPGRLRMNIEPGDATIYVDGRFLGTGKELSELHSGLILESGKHTLDVVRPGFDGETIDFLLDAGSEIELTVKLISKGSGEEV